ncbi:ATP-binding protein [Microbacterium elymi]|uniref:histidine kinase n=1 Tax=Microbacterium elymi TaxID=2909587 RepID=A0ABY5NNE6_9MICO|nr:ATP-binding protein [Microbacterium elymi]UUT36690.1 ATP-binding protein [Microbacterium elymi]
MANILANARRYTADDSPIDLAVGVDAAAGTGWIAIADHGEGIPPQIRDQIFQRFWRADTSRTRETGGSGLGLSIVASIVDVLHGSVSVSDTPGGGATFRVAFPLAHGWDAADHLGIETQAVGAAGRRVPIGRGTASSPGRGGGRVLHGSWTPASGHGDGGLAWTHPRRGAHPWPSIPSTATRCCPPPPRCAARSTDCRARRTRCSPS